MNDGDWIITGIIIFCEHHRNYYKKCASSEYTAGVWYRISLWHLKNKSDFQTNWIGLRGVIIVVDQ